MATVNQEMGLVQPDYTALNTGQKVGLAITSIGILLLFMAWAGFSMAYGLWICLGCLSIGSIYYAYASYQGLPEGIKNHHNFTRSLTSKGALAWVSAIVITGFYVCLYWFPATLGLGSDGAANTGMVAMFDPLSYWLKGQAASQWFVYGTLYTLLIICLGIKFMLKYRHNRYQQVRTLSVMFFQLGFAFLLPEFLIKLNLPYNDFKNMWPLNYYFFDEWNLKAMMNAGNIGWFMIIWGVLMIVLISPILTYFYGKRWYCSWVCGCGGLAETAGDPFRHLSDKSLSAWKVERWMIHSVLVFALLMTALVLYGYFSGQSHFLFIEIYPVRSTYGFLIGAAFSGVVGVGFYPLMGSRVWCRFGCPMAAILGIQQKFFSRFRITTNGSQCISCGNCSTYCEMGIDVKWYAQRGQDIVRASCVGCGVCSAVCPRGVLKLENGPQSSRKLEPPLNITGSGIKVLD